VFGIRASLLRFVSLCVERPPSCIKMGTRFLEQLGNLHPLTVLRKILSVCGVRVDAVIVFCYL